MFALFDTILWPIRWIVELILVAWHWVFTNVFGMDPAAGLTWVLSIIALTAVVRAALIPIVVRQIKNQRRMLEVAPQIKKIQQKYKGKRDQYSRQQMSRETMELYKKTGTNPLSSCLPLLMQMPVFFALFRVLDHAQLGQPGVGPLNAQLGELFAHAKLFGAPLNTSFSSAMNAEPKQVGVMIIAAVMVALMTSSQFFTQLQITSKNMSAEAKASPTYKQQRMMMYFIPLAFLFSGYAFPLGVMFYWLTSNIWTMGQQYVVIRGMPTPGSEAAKAREARLARRGKLIDESSGEVIVDTENTTTQRAQPMSKKRAKKQGVSPTEKLSQGDPKPGAKPGSGAAKPGSGSGGKSGSSAGAKPAAKPGAKSDPAAGPKSGSSAHSKPPAKPGSTPPNDSANSTSGSAATAGSKGTGAQGPGAKSRGSKAPGSKASPGGTGGAKSTGRGRPARKPRASGPANQGGTGRQGGSGASGKPSGTDKKK